MAMSDRVVVFDKGAALQIDTPLNIYRKPSCPFVADFVGRINFLRGMAQEGEIVFAGGQRMDYEGGRRGPVCVAVRPENIRMRRERGVLRGRLAQSYYLGDVCDCRVDVDGTADAGAAAQVRVIAPGHAWGGMQPGSAVWLDFDECIVFADEDAAQPAS